MGYTKLFSEIVGSTVWQESNPTRIVWITMLAMKDGYDIVNVSIPGLARLAGVTQEEVEIAIEKFTSPDPFSRSQEHEGRRIKRVDGGWLVLNGARYRARLNREERNEYQRVKQAEYREKKKEINQ